MTSLRKFDDPSVPVLVLFCKQPLPGNGKQRLAAEIGETAACRIAEGLLNCALEDAAGWPGELTIAPSAPSELEWAQSLAALCELPVYSYPRTVRVAAQSDGNLGERLNDMDRRHREAGARRLVFMASDVPSLQREHFETVTDGLDAEDVVLADDADGGVTLMANREPWPDLTDLPWSSADLGEALHMMCLASGHSVLRTPGGFDVDTKSDLDTLVSYLHSEQRPARQSLAGIIETYLRPESSTVALGIY